MSRHHKWGWFSLRKFTVSSKKSFLDFSRFSVDLFDFLGNFKEIGGPIDHPVSWWIWIGFLCLLEAKVRVKPKRVWNRIGCEATANYVWHDLEWAWAYRQMPRGPSLNPGKTTFAWNSRKSYFWMNNRLKYRLFINMCVYTYIYMYVYMYI